MIRFVFILLVALTSLQLCGQNRAKAEPLKGPDPWVSLRKSFPKKNQVSKPLPQTRIEKRDPWQCLRLIVIPFSLADDEKLSRGPDSDVAKKVRRKFAPWRQHIRRSARLFQVPVAIIEAVIMVESGGNPRARAKTSSAAGLMQTIKATFAEGRRALTARGITCADDPFDPEASILVGTWYLGRMFDQARSDGKPGVKNRSTISSWQYPLQYYYSGPGHGRKKAPRILIYSGGERIIIDKPAYSRKVMTWAENLSAT